MRRLFPLILLLIAHIPVSANMSSPDWNGTRTSEAYSSKDIDILKERIDVKLLQTGQAQFTIVYTIQSNRRGVQIPLIFDTMTDRYRSSEEGFKVWMNDEEVTVSSVPSTYNNPDTLRWIDSIGSYLNYSEKEIPDLVGLKYFEVDIPDGVNIIRVEYTADATRYLGSLVTEFSYSYNLEPARYWRSFGDLYIKVDASEIDAEIETDFGDSSGFTGVKEWHFSELPQDTFTLSYTPKIYGFASLLIVMEAGGLALIFTLLLIVFHILWILRYRWDNPGKRFSPVVIIGSLTIPWIYCALYTFLPGLIDRVIGDYASRRHGYVFLIFFIYPIYVLFYFPIPWFIDFVGKKCIRRRSVIE